MLTVLCVSFFTLRAQIFAPGGGLGAVQHMGAVADVADAMEVCRVSTMRAN